MASFIGKVVTGAKNFVKNNIAETVQEGVRIFPDGLIFASGFFALITLSRPYAIFFASMAESLVAFHLLRSLTDYLGIFKALPTGKDYNDSCRTGFSSQTLDSLSLFSTLNYGLFPSAPVFMFATAASYVFTSLNTLSKEMEALGPAYSQRYYVSMVFLLLSLFALLSYRLMFGCDSFGVLMMSTVAGIVLGMLLIQQNTAFFGSGGVNLLGVPLLRSKAANGQPIYVCPTRQQSA
jgi:hypothetical protein